MFLYEKRGFQTFVLTILFLGFSSSVGLANLNEGFGRHDNVAEFVCGLNNQERQAVSGHDMFIRFYNPHAFPVMLNNFLRIDNEKGVEEPELSDKYLNVLISPNRHFEMDCRYINDLFFDTQGDNSLKEARSFEAYLHSKSMRYLEIVMEFSSFSPASNVKTLQ